MLFRSNLELVVYRYALAGYRYRIYDQLLKDMPWLDTGIESGIGRLQICPGWIQESNLETRLQICPGWIQELNLEFIKGW